jgi:hypothetical protein
MASVIPGFTLLSPQRQFCTRERLRAPRLQPTTEANGTTEPNRTARVIEGRRARALRADRSRQGPAPSAPSSERASLGPGSSPTPN